MNAVHLRVVAGDEHYALPVSNVLGISAIGEVTPVPGAPQHVIGVRNLRGRVIPLIDLAALLGLGDGSTLTWIVVGESRGRRCGFAVSRTLDVSELGETDDDIESPYLTGAELIDGAMVGVVDVEAIFDALTPAVAA